MNKKVKFGDLKLGTKFRYKRGLYLKDDMGGVVRISDGAVDPNYSEIQDDTLVTPVKVKITVL